MKKALRIAAVATLAGTIFSSISPPQAEAADFMPIYAPSTAEFPFTDVPLEHKERIFPLYPNKFFNGISADKFGWNLTIKRMDAAVIVARGMGFRKEHRSLPEKWLTFQDVPDRAKQAVTYLQYHRVVNGKTETLFGSNDTITRGEAALILSRAYADVLVSPAEPVQHFEDATGRYAEAINKLVAAGITHGKTSDRFGTSDPVTRGDFAIMVARLSDPSLSPASFGDLPPAQGGITMKAEKESYRLSSDPGVWLTITNEEDFAYGYRHQYILEKKQGDKWLEIKENKGLSYTTDIPYIEAGETIKVRISFDRFKTLITAGEYRIKNTFGSSSIAAEFTIHY